MAGSPLKRALVTELTRLAKAADVTPLEYVCDRVSGGETIRAIHTEICHSVKKNMSDSVMRRWIARQTGGPEALKRARKEWSHSKVEETIEILENADETRESIAKAKAQVDQINFIAGAYNREEFGPPSAAVNVQVNLPAQHLDALRAYNSEVKATALLGDGSVDVEIVTG